MASNYHRLPNRCTIWRGLTGDLSLMTDFPHVLEIQLDISKIFLENRLNLLLPMTVIARWGRQNWVGWTQTFLMSNVTVSFSRIVRFT